MNGKQAALLMAIAPPLLVVGGLYFLLKWLLSDKKKTGNAPVSFAPLCPLNSGGNAAEKRGIPAISAGKSNVTPAPSVPISEDLPPPLPPKRPVILREDMAKIFRAGSRALYRKNAVTELQSLGFGKTAAYEALSASGRFGSWLQIAPDGIITWKS